METEKEISVGRTADERQNSPRIQQSIAECLYQNIRCIQTRDRLQKEMVAFKSHYHDDSCFSFLSKPISVNITPSFSSK